MAEKKTKEKSGDLAISRETVDVLVTNIIPTTKYFESRFDLMEERMKHLREDTQRQIDHLSEDMKQRFEQVNERFGQVDKRLDQFDKRFEQVNERFEQVDKRFEQVDKRFEQVNKRFEQVDRRFEQVDKRFEKVDVELCQVRDNIAILTDRISELTTEVKTSVRDYIIERDRYYDRKFNQLRMFIIAMLVGVGGLFLEVAGFFDRLFR